MFCQLQSKAYAGRAPTDNGVQTRLKVRAQPCFFTADCFRVPNIQRHTLQRYEANKI